MEPDEVESFVAGEAEIVEQKVAEFSNYYHFNSFSGEQIKFNNGNCRISARKKLDGVKGLRDESTKDIRIVIDLKKYRCSGKSFKLYL